MENDSILPMPEFPSEQEFAQQNETITPPFYSVPPKPPSPFAKFLKPVLGIASILLVIILLVFFISSRNKSNENGGVSGKTTLVYWGILENSSVMQAVISGFEKENPNIQVDYVQQDMQNYRDKLITRINNGNGPDIFSFHNTWFPMLSTVLLPLPSTTISASDFSASYYPVATKDLVKNKVVYGIPLGIDTLALYINSSMFKATGLIPPTNWNDFLNDARVLTVKDANGKIKTAGAAMGTFENVDYAPDILSMLFVQNGVNLNDMPPTINRVVDTLNFYTSFTIDPTNSVWDNTLDASTLAFSKGNLAMYFGYSKDYFTIKAYNPNLSFEIVPAPQLTGQDTTIASYWAEGASIRTSHQKETLSFMKYLTREDVEDKLYAAQAKTRAFGEPFAKVKMAARLSADPNVYPFVLQAKTATSSYFAFGTYDNGLNKQANAYLENAINAVLGGNVTTEDTASALSEGVAQISNQYK